MNINNVLSSIKPSPNQEKEVKSRINTIIKKIKIPDTKVILGGSGAKGTWLKNSYDADIFVLFNYEKFKNKSDKLSEILEKGLKKTLKSITKIHGSRDYFQYHDKDFTFEIVPILGISSASKALNITDVSPLHAKWVNKKGNQKLKDDIRLIKQFAKANNLYGAESYIQGFSGYVLEILTLHYKGFNQLINAITKWKDKTLLDPEKYYKNTQDIKLSINKSKQSSPLIIIDPVQKERNAAAAIGIKKYKHFIKICKQYTKKPSEDFFKIKEFDPNNISQKTIILQLRPLTGKDDIIGCKVVKILNHLNKLINHSGFSAHESDWDWNKKDNLIYIWFKIKELDIPSIYEHKGPPINIPQAVIDFKANYTKTYIQKDHIYTKIKRNHTNIKNLIKDSLKDQYIKERVKKIWLM